MLEKHGFRWSVEEIKEQHSSSGEDKKLQPESEDGPDDNILALKAGEQPSDPCACCGLPVSHQFFTCMHCQKHVCVPCKATGKMSNHRLLRRLIFNQNVDEFVKNGGGVEHDTNTTTKRIRNENYADYEPLDRNTREIRLLSIMPSQDDDEPLSCFTIKATISEAEKSYVALSYCWGDMRKQQGITISHSQKDPAGEPIFGPFKPLRVTENLFKCLKNIRKTLRTEERLTWRKPFWIDALCINQGNYEERAHQVSMMGHVYENADSVWVFIGDSEEIQFGMQLIQEFERSEQQFGRETHQNSDPIVSPPSSLAESMTIQAIRDVAIKIGEAQYRLPDLVRAFSHVFKQPWFTRIWVLQEVFRAQGPVYVYSGMSHFVNFRAILLGNDKIFSAATSDEVFHESNNGSLPTAWRMLSSISRWHNKTSEPASAKTKCLILLFRATYKSFEATDPRDKLFALLGLAKKKRQITSSSSHLTIPARLAIDYTKSTSKVFCDLTLWCIEHHRNLDVLSVVGETTGNRSSWALWHRAKSSKICGNLILTHRHFDVSGERSLDIALLKNTILPMLTLKGLRVGTVKTIHFGVLQAKSKTGGLQREFSVFNHRTNQESDSPLPLLWPSIKAASASMNGEVTHVWLGHPESAYKGDEEAMFRDFLKTIMLKTSEPGKGNIWEEEKIAHRLALYWKRHDPEFRQLPPSVRDFMEPLATKDATWKPNDDFVSRVPIHGKVLFMSDELRLGLCPAETKVGDVIVVLFGGKVPFILRPKQSVPLPDQPDGQEWVFVGECFVHGRMHSGVVDEKLRQNVPIENFHLV